ncbi:SpoIIE family protein phosphatase [Bacillus massiliigorillae]|uniref:SpoIIE family protein phosphatase n=1 Tax=Bacillus massiliigorillae TaxID=1243664 RepID=UPI00039F2644|nr:SpoIIE family protein phosphatase [Bacillus massiliigorillae]
MRCEMMNDKVELIVKQIAKGNNHYCGDAYFYTTTEEYFICVLADGLGSGEFAYESSTAITEIVESNHQLAIEDLLAKCNEALVKKRGAAVAIFKVIFKERQFQYISVGNIRFFLYKPISQKLIYPLPTNGYLCGRLNKFHKHTYSYEPLSRFMFFSDGLELKGTTSYMKKEVALSLIIEEIWNQNGAKSDDVTLIMGSLLQ